jgi:hypothetical protein
MRKLIISLALLLTLMEVGRELWTGTKRSIKEIGNGTWNI